MRVPRGTFALPPCASSSSSSSFFSASRVLSQSAAVDSSSTIQQQKTKKVSKLQRRTMVADFVEKYRADNSGRFPSLIHTKKCVGGSHYIVREIIQELEYKHKRCLLDEKDVQYGSAVNVVRSNLKTKEPPSVLDEVAMPTKGVEKSEIDAHAEIREAITESSARDVGQAVKGKESEHPEMDSFSNEQFIKNVGKSERTIRDGQIDVKGPGNVPESPSASLEGDGQIHAVTEMDLNLKTEKSTEGTSSFHEIKDGRTKSQPPSKKKTKSQPLERFQDADGHSGKQLDNDETQNSNELFRKHSRKAKEPPTESSDIWGGLKALADGFYKFWRGE